MRLKYYLHDFVKYFPSLLCTPHSSKTFSWQSKPNLHLQHKACNQVFPHRMSSFLFSLFQLGPSHPYFIPELCSHSRNTFGHYPWSPHQRAANGVAPKAGQAQKPSSATRNLSRHQVRLGDCCLRFFRAGVSWRCHRYFLLQGGKTVWAQVPLENSQILGNFCLQKFPKVFVFLSPVCRWQHLFWS